jgi:hypothetical protein
MIKFFADPLLRANLKTLGYRGRRCLFYVDQVEVAREVAHAAAQHPEETLIALQARAWARLIYRNWHRPKNAPIQPREVRVFGIAVLVLLVLILFSARAHAQVNTVQWQQGGTTIKVWGGGLLRVNCSTNVTCAWDAANFRINISATGGGGSGTVTSVSTGNLSPIFTASVATPTVTPALSFALSNAAAHSFLGNCTGSVGTPGYCQPKSTDLADFSATAPTTSGKIPIWDQPSQTYIPGDPLVQGLVGDGSTTAENPVAVGGYDTAGTPALHRNTLVNANPAGTEYGLVTRNMVQGQLAQPVSASSLPLPSNAAQETGGNLATIAACHQSTSRHPRSRTLRNTSLASIDAKTPALTNSAQPVLIVNTQVIAQPPQLTGQQLNNPLLFRSLRCNNFAGRTYVRDKGATNEATVIGNGNAHRGRVRAADRRHADGAAGQHYDSATVCASLDAASGSATLTPPSGQRSTSLPSRSTWAAPAR